MQRLLLQNAVLLDPEAPAPAPGALLLENGVISARLPPGAIAPEPCRRLDLSGRRLAPGLIDLHYHGGLIFAAPDRYLPSLRQSSASLLRQGTTAFLATTVAWGADSLAQRVGSLAGALGATDWPGAVPIGLHLEGPWINAEAAGAQPRGAIRPYAAVEGGEVFERAAGSVRMVTLAPEVEGVSELFDELARRSIVAALGHTLCDSEMTQWGIEQGLRHATHLFNAMGRTHHREPGALGVALADDRLSADLICDGVHVHPLMVRLAARAKRDRLILITDRMELPEPGTGGEGAEGYDFGAGSLRDDGSALRLPDGRLAGSRLGLGRALANAVAFGAMTLHEAVAACTLRPARLLGIEAERGTLRPGARADLVVLDAAGSVVQTWICGRPFDAAAS